MSCELSTSAGSCVARTALMSVIHFTTICFRQYLIGVATGAGALLLAFMRFVVSLCPVLEFRKILVNDANVPFYRLPWSALSASTAQRRIFASMRIGW